MVVRRYCRLVRALASTAAAVTLLQWEPLVAESPSDAPTPIGRALEALVLDRTVTADDRAAGASALRDFCKLYADAIPTLSPREQDWLDAEMKSGRWFAALSTTEYSKNHASQRSRNCFAYAEQLVGLTMKRTAAARRREALVWALLANELLDPDWRAHVENLARHHLVDLSNQEMLGLETTPRIGRAIVEGILIPHLLSEAR